mgnify:CR=1 FL=1
MGPTVVRLCALGALLGASSSIAWAAPPPEVREAEARAGGIDSVRPTSPAAGSGFTFLGLMQTRAITSNVVPTNPILDGQIIGIIGGTNLTTVLPEDGKLDLDEDGEPDEDQGVSGVVEQRMSAFFTYAPPVYDGELAFTAGFEVDFNWGDRSYNVGGNTGGGIGADMVNLQTRRLHATYKKRFGGGHDLEVVSGLQFVGGSVYNPATARPDDLFRSGVGTSFFGTEAAGVTAYGRVHNRWGDRFRYKAGLYTLLEQGSARIDDATLVMLSAAVQPEYALWLGVHAWALQDRTHGTAGTIGSGPTSALSELQGGPRLDFRVGDMDINPWVDGDFGWLVGDVGYNHRLDRGPLGVTALAGLNAGKIYVKDQVDVPVQGWFTEGELRVRYMPGPKSVFRLGWVASSRDGNGRDAYTGVITANQYGVVGAIYATHGCYLLFPDPMSVNRMTAIVGDVSNRGEGLRALTGSMSADLIPGKLDARFGGGHALDGNGSKMGTEVNGTVTAHPWLFTDLSLAAARVVGSEVRGLDDKPLPNDPWTIVLSMNNLFF